jgi:pimeloyl-ACP methyl ester carboxylesterase
VLAVHGITATHLSWAAVAAAAPDVDLIAPDLRGRGGSAQLPGPAGLRAHADDLAALLDAVGLERVVVAGHSMGGLVAVVFADVHPDRTERLVLVDGGLPLELPPGVSVADAAAAGLGPAAERLAMTFPTRQAYQDFWGRHPALQGGITPLVAAYLDYDLVPAQGGFRSGVSTERVAEDLVSEFDPDVLAPALERLAVPAVLLLAPRGLLNQPEPLYPRPEVAAWQTRLDQLRVVEVPDVNHYTIVFDPAAAARVAAELSTPTPPGAG